MSYIITYIIEFLSLCSESIEMLRFKKAIKSYATKIIHITTRIFWCIMIFSATSILRKVTKCTIPTMEWSNKAT